MKRFLSAFIAMLLMLLLFCATSFAASVYKVTIDVDFIGNLIFSTYDVDMYLNDLLLEQLPHGKDYEGTFYAEEGTNTIYFYKDGDKSIKGTLKIDLTGDATVKCTIYCHSNEITVRDVSINIETPSIQNAVPEISDAPAAEAIVTEEPKTEAESTVRSFTESDNESVTVESTEEKNDPEKTTVSFADVDLSSMTDQELADALAAIKTEQKKRVKTRIVLDRSEITLLVGKTDKLTAMVEDLPEGESEPILEWHTSDKNLVTCSDGTIKALKEGSVIISCSGTLANGASIYSECSVQTVIPIASVAAEKASINMMTGETYTPTFKFKPENASVKKMTYISSKPEVASVDANGTIKGLTAGNTVITATTTDGSQKTATIKVKVAEKEYFPKQKSTTLTGKKTGIVCEVLNEQFSSNLKDLFRNQMLPTVAATMTAYQLSLVDKKFDVDINYKSDSIMYIGLSKKDNTVLFMAFQDVDGKFYLASVTPKKNTIVYTKSKISRDEVKEFMNESCSQYTGVSADEVLYANEIVGSLEE